MTSNEPPVSLWQSGRRARLHIMGPIVIFFTVALIFLAHQEIRGGKGNWSDFAVAAGFAFAGVLPLVAYSTLRGPMMETDRDLGRLRASRNKRMGVTLYLVMTVVLGDRLTSWASPTFYGAFAGFFLGLLLGIGGVWLYHHLRGRWPPDFEQV